MFATPSPLFFSASPSALAKLAKIIYALPKNIRQHSWHVCECVCVCLSGCLCLCLCVCLGECLGHHYDYSYAAFATIMRRVISCVSATKVMTTKICHEYFYYISLCESLLLCVCVCAPADKLPNWRLVEIVATTHIFLLFSFLLLLLLSRRLKPASHSFHHPFARFA